MQFEKFMDLLNVLQHCIASAREAGALIREAWNRPSSFLFKQGVTSDLVTETDQACERLILERLRVAFPDFEFIGEESTAAGAQVLLTDAPTFMIDPIDGTTNFVHRLPFVCVSIGLVIEKQPVLGVIYNPILDQLYSAVKGQGAYLNENIKLQVSKCSKLSQALAATEHGCQLSNGHWRKVKLENMNKLMPLAPAISVHGIRSLGSAALNLCYLASGAFDLYFEHGIHCWDVCAGCIIVQEAGGLVCQLDHSPIDLMSRRLVAAATPALANELCQQLVDVLDYPRDD